MGLSMNFTTAKIIANAKKTVCLFCTPVLDAVEKVVSPQEWAKDSYLGELSMFDWEPAYHQRQATNYGAVCANPMKSQRYLDEIQRMLGMFLQYGIEDNTSFSRSIG